VKFAKDVGVELEQERLEGGVEKSEAGFELPVSSREL
jgi:hypothetical protein